MPPLGPRLYCFITFLYLTCSEGGDESRASSQQGAPSPQGGEGEVRRLQELPCSGQRRPAHQQVIPSTDPGTWQWMDDYPLDAV